jgi:hypothetical protein
MTGCQAKLKGMRRIFLALIPLICFPVALLAANLKLYLKDGNYHIVREYKVEKDRVRYYSVERGDWEEIPVSLIDLKRTESEIVEHKAAIAEEAKILTEEDKAARELQDEILKIPQNPGVYSVDGGLKIFKLAESKVHTNKGRSVWKAMSPIPIVAGKATLELDEDHSLNIVTNDRPDLYIQLETDERFGIVKLTPHHGVRIVERLTIVPVTKEVIEEMDQVPIFRKQLTQGGLYKIWPEKPMENGEYAVVEYTEGKSNTQIWDFAVKAK